MQQWETTPEGEVRLQPILSWQTATVPTGGLVQIQYADSLEDIDQERRKAVQLYMSSTQARELANALLQMAGTMDGG